MTSDSQLISGHLKGDKRAFEMLVTKYQQRIYNFSLRMVQNPDDAADLTQEIFILVFRKLHTFRGDSKFSTWLYSIACNTCRDFLRRRKPMIPISDSMYQKGNHVGKASPDFNQNDPAERLEKKELAQVILEGIVQLPTDYRMVLLLHDLHGFRYREIADLLNISIGTVKSRLSRARFKLSRRLVDLRGTNEAIEPSYIRNIKETRA